jgi:trehalose 2-sulfotransferase
MGASGPPQTSYLICTTPRSGSTLLCELLTGTGIAGRPDEYFQQLRSTGRPMRPRDYLEGVAPDIVPPETHDGELEEHQLYDPHRFCTFEEYVDWVKNVATTPNGVFGTKIMWPYMAGLVDGLTTVPGERETAAPDELLAGTFPGLRYVWLRRMDKVRQAVSLWRALQTQTWRGGSGAQPTAVYSRAAIAHLTTRLADHDASWGAFFAHHGLRPLELVYEEYVDDVPGAVAEVLKHLGLPPIRIGNPEPPMRRQADAISDEWAEAYRRGIAVRPHNTPHPLSPTPE